MENSSTAGGWKPRKGRKTKLDNELLFAITAHVASGQYFETACRMAGVHPASGYRWKERGERLLSEHPDDYPEDPEDRLFCEFCEALASAHAESVARSVVDIKKAGASDWRAHAWYLERTRPDLYGSVERHVHQLGKSSDAELVAEAARLFGRDFAQTVGSTLGTGSGATEAEDQGRR